MKPQLHSVTGPIESKLEGTVNYLQVVDCILDAAKQNETLQGRLLHEHEEAYLCLLIDLHTKMTIKVDK